MPYQRKNSNNWYTKIRLPGVGKIRRSLETESKGRAEKLETAIRELHGRPGGIEILKAFADGAELNGRKVSAHDLYEAWAKGQPGELLERLKEKPVPTLAEAVAETLEQKEANVAASTLQRYRASFDHVLAFFGPGTPVDEALTDDAANSFKRHRLKKDKAAKQTVNNDVGALSALATRAVKKGWIAERPTIERFKYKKRIRYLEPPELERYMQKLRADCRPIMRVLWGAGLRLGEAESLRGSDVQGRRLRVREGKTAAASRSVRLPEWLADELEEREPAPDGRLFPEPARRTIQAEHNKACTAAKIEDYTLHDHRHTYGVSMARAGMPLGVLQRQMGHESIQTTMKYAEFHPDYQDTDPYFEKVADRYGLNGTEEDGDDE